MLNENEKQFNCMKFSKWVLYVNLCVEFLQEHKTYTWWSFILLHAQN